MWQDKKTHDTEYINDCENKVETIKYFRAGRYFLACVVPS